MASTHLNEHDANQGAQSSGEFLGMTGNSGWYLLGSAGATVLMVIVLWGIFGVPLLVCFLMGAVLCVGAISYVFLLKNNRPAHYDTDFFEVALVEAGVLRFSFEPRSRRPANPFADLGADCASAEIPRVNTRHRVRMSPAMDRPRRDIGFAVGSTAIESDSDTTGKARKEERPQQREAAHSDHAYEQLQEQLATTEEFLEDVLAERGED